MSRSAWPALALLLSIPLLTAARKADEEEIKVSWDHPYLSNRFFDYTHEQWRAVDTDELPAFFQRSNTTYEFTPEGDTLYTWDVVLEIHEPDQMGPLLFLDWLSSHEDSEIVAFDATFKSAGRTEVLDRSRLVEGGFDDGSRYVSEDRALALTVPRDRPGTLSFTVTTRAPAYEGLEAYFGGSVLVQRDYYIGERDISFVVPEGTTLRFESRFFGQKPLDVTAGGKRTYTYRFRHLMPPWWDAGAPHSRDAFPSIFWSNQRTNADLGRILSAVWEPNLGASPAMQELAEAVVDGLETVEDKAEAIHDLVADGWGYLGFYPGESGWIPHPASSCFEARLGDCKDQAALMIALMRSVGLTAWPVVVYAGQPLNPPRVPAILANHAVVWVEDPSKDGGGFLVDSTDTGTAAFPPGDWITGRKVFLIHPEDARYLKIPLPGSQHRLQEDETTIALSADGSAAVHVVERWHGGAANRRAALRRSTPPAWWKRRLEEHVVGTIPGARLLDLTEGEDVDDDNAFVLEAHVDASDLLEVVGDRAILSLPWPRGYRDDLPVEAQRVHPRVQEGYEHRHRMRVQLPDGAELVSWPRDAEEVRDDWVYRLHSEVVDRELIVDLSVSSKPGRVSSRMEEVRRNFFAALTEVQRRPVVLLLPEAGR
jgi:transglutaminase-like putative cysteine protease